MRTNHVKKWLAVLLLPLAAASANAYDAEIDGIYYDFSGDEAYVTYKAMPLTNNKEAYSGSIAIPDEIIYDDKTYSVTMIGNNAFAGCSNLTSVNIPNSVASIGHSAFYNCTSLTSAIIPEGVTKIGKNAYYGCTNLAHVTIPNSVTSIGSVPFQGSNNITSINIDTENIANNIFSSRKKLGNIVLGEHVRNLANAAFKNCTAIKEIYCYAEEPPTVYEGSFSGVDVASVTLVVPDDSYDAYKAHEVWGQFWIETATGIASLTPSPSPGRGEIYNVSGQMVNGRWLNGKLPRGIYIKDGKKIFVK